MTAHGLAPVVATRFDARHVLAHALGAGDALPDRILQIELRPHLFDHPPARRLVEIAQAMRGAGDRVSLGTVRARVRQDEPGVLSYLDEIAKVVVDPADRDLATMYVDTLRDTARRREAEQAHLCAADAAKHGQWEAAKLEAERAVALAPRPAVPARLVRPDLHALCLAQVGAYKRIPTGIAPLDEMLGGGIQTNRCIVLGGPPGVVKTGLTIYIGWQLARARRAVVAYVAHDERRSGIYSRIAQIEGVTRGQLEDGTEIEQRAAWETAAERMAAVPLFTVWDRNELDGNPEPLAVETIVADAKLESAERGLPLIVVVDSIQKARFACVQALPPGTSPREATDEKVEALKRIFDRDTCVIATSELNRGGYAPGAEAGLGSFKESGGIEYGGDVPLLMSRVREEPGFVVEIKSDKNRQGDEGKFRLRRIGCTFEPVEMPSAEEIAEAKATRRAAAEDARDRRAEDAIERAVLAGRITTRDDLFKACRGDVGKTPLTAALKRMRDAGRLSGGNGEPYAVTPRAGDDFGGDPE